MSLLTNYQRLQTSRVGSDVEMAMTLGTTVMMPIENYICHVTNVPRITLTLLCEATVLASHSCWFQSFEGLDSSVT